MLFKTIKIRESYAFIKNIENKHGGLKEGDTFDNYFEIHIVKAYKKPINRIVEEGVLKLIMKGSFLIPKQNCISQK